jgi:hypothetical protein
MRLGVSLFIYGAEVVLWECGNREAISKSSGKGGKPDLGFPRFPAARHFHSVINLMAFNFSCRSCVALGDFDNL